MTTAHQPRKKILFATFPADGHFNPLTGLAVHLIKKGHDVRWYTQDIYAAKLQKLNIRHYPFNHALQFNAQNFGDSFPKRNSIKSQIGKLKFDLINIFVSRAPEFYRDIQEINDQFEFDIMIADVAFTAIPFVSQKMKKPVIAIGVLPLIETSKDLPPTGLGLQPSYTFTGRIKQWLLRAFADQVIFKSASTLYKKLLAKEGVTTMGSNLFDVVVKSASLVLQIGTPSFEYKRSDLGKNIRFIGALLPHQVSGTTKFEFAIRHRLYKKIILVTQGTIEKDTKKLIEPVLEAFKDTVYLVIATTGGSGTAELRSKYNCHNIIIENFIPFADVMPHCHVFITNGGYGGVILGIENTLPLVVAGIHEGKNELNARVDYFKLGIDLKTESPSPFQIKSAVDKIIADPSYRENVAKLADEFKTYDPYVLSEEYVELLTKELHPQKKVTTISCL